MPENQGVPVILIVDDDPTILEIAAETLEGSGFQVYTAENGYRGLQLFDEKKESIDLVLLDWAMPGLDGLEVFAAIRQLVATMPIIFSSGFSSQSLIEKIDFAPPPAFLQKPYQLHELIELARNMVRCP